MGSADVVVVLARRHLGGHGQLRHDVRPGAVRAPPSVLANAMESVEDIPASCILDGLPWNWESYGEYLDVVDAMPKGINTGGYVGDVALRTYVDRRRRVRGGLRRDRRRARRDGPRGRVRARGRRARLLDLPIAHPPRARRSLGSRDVVRPAASSSPSPSRSAASAGACSSARPGSTRSTAPRSRVDEEMAWISELSRTLGRPFTFNLMQMRSLGDHYRRVLELAAEANRSGAQLRPQTTPRGIGVLFGLAANTPIDHLAGYSAARAARLRRPPRRAPRPRGRGGGSSRTRPTTRHVVVRPHVPDDARHRRGRTTTAPSDSIGRSRAGRAASRRSSTTSTRSSPPTAAAVVNWPVLNEDFDAIARAAANRR